MGDAVRVAWEDWLAAECEAQPLVIILEDLQWGDAATVRLVDSTLRTLRDAPLMVVAFARPEVFDQLPSLWSEREVQVIKLGPLSRRASEQLIRAALGPEVNPVVAAKLVDRAQGNPFYLEELIRAVAGRRVDELPDSVLGTVEARLDVEGSEAKRVLRAASVFGDRFSRDAVASLLGGDRQRAEVTAWLDALATRELIARVDAPSHSGDEQYAFRHGLLRQAAYAMLTGDDRSLGHKLAGEWLQRTGHTDAVAIAEHFRMGGDLAHAIGWFRRAAEQALDANDLEAAVARAECGVSCGADGEDLGHLRLVQAEAEVWRGAADVAEARGTEALSLLTPGSSAWFRALTRAATGAGKLGEYDRVEQRVATALATAPSAGATSAQIICLCECASHLIFGGRLSAADKLLERIRRAAPTPRPSMLRSRLCCSSSRGFARRPRGTEGHVSRALRRRFPPSKALATSETQSLYVRTSD